jgi:hypothetical protein
MINPWRLATAAALCELGIIVWIASAGSADIKKAAPPNLSRLALLTADIATAPPPRPTVTGDVPISNVDITAVPATTTAVANESKPIVVAALTEPSEVLPPDSTPPEAPAVTVAIAAPRDIRDAVDSAAILDECPVVDNCIDRYLFALYQRTPKQDSIKLDEQRKVTVKRKGKTVTVTRTFSTVVDEDFAWKDTKAADKIEMPMMDYVIGGMDRSFKLRLFYMLHAAEEAGLSPGITSAFRDDYRQSIASGLKAASDRSYHGGSSRGGYGHGLAADVVSVNGTTRALRQAATEIFWKWIDTHGKDFGIGRPYLDRDPPHVGPIDGEEYAKHRGTKTVRAASDAKDRKAGRDDTGGAKRSKTARS